MPKLENAAKVLLAEDNVMNQLFTKAVLTRFGCLVDIAANGAAAVEMVKNRA